jgi:hypothetical protein
VPSLTGSVGKNGRNRLEDARLVQQLLNRYRSRTANLLRVDGMVGTQTLSAIEDFQRNVMHMSNPDQLISPDGRTFKTLCGGDTLVFKIAWGAKVSGAFKQKTIRICDALKIPVDFLMSAMAFESGETFSSNIKNAAGSGAVGLIQFMPGTARALGSTTDDLACMSPVQQLDYVDKYFAPRRGRLNSLEDVYMAILYPAAIGWKPSATLFASPGVTYAQNVGLDANRDGRITVQEAAARVRAKLDKGLLPGFLG